jgi:hypothetical protein
MHRDMIAIGNFFAKALIISHLTTKPGEQAGLFCCIISQTCPKHCSGAQDRKATPMFMYTLRKFSDITEEHGSALAVGDSEALLQIRDDRRRNDKPDLPFRVSDDPQSDYYLEKRVAYPMGNGYTSAMRAPIETVYVSGR